MTPEVGVLAFPDEVSMLIEQVTSFEAQTALRHYRDATLEYVRELKSHPGQSQEEIEEFKRPTQAALDALEKYSLLPSVGEAILAIAFGEMSLH